MDFTPEFELGGYAEVRFADQILTPSPYGVESTPWNLYERVRPSFKITPSQRVSAEVVVEGSMAQGRDPVQASVDELNASPLGPLLGASGCTLDQDSRYTSASDYLSVERLHVDFNLPAMDVSIGRQALRWGSSLAFHPTDPFVDVIVNEPWREPVGVNAIKANVPLPKGGGIVGALVVGDDLSGLFPASSASGTFEGVPLSGVLRGTVHALDTDFTGLTTVQGETGEWRAGWDLRGNLTVGWWDEGAFKSDPTNADHPQSVENIVGLDYSFPVAQSLYLAVEYRYDGSGYAPEDYPEHYVDKLSGSSVTVNCPGESSSDPQYTITPSLSGVRSGQAARTTIGIHYLDAGVRLAATNDFTVSASTIFNLLDQSGVVIPDVQLNVGQRVALHLGGQVPFGKAGTEFRPDASMLYLHVEGPGTNETADLTGLVPRASLQAWARYSF